MPSASLRSVLLRMASSVFFLRRASRQMTSKPTDFSSGLKACNQSTMTSTCASTLASRQTSPLSSTTQIDMDLKGTSIPMK